MIHNQFESTTNIISLDESKTDLYYYDKSPFSMIQTCSSFKETKNQEEQITSNFLEVIKPTPIYSSKPYNNLFMHTIIYRNYVRIKKSYVRDFLFT